MKLELRQALKEAARDTLALGGIAFYILVIARALIGPYWSYVYQLFIAFIILFLLTLFIKNSENHIARTVVLAFFTILFYNETRFTIFAIAIFFILVVSAGYLKISRAAILKGGLLGAASTLASYYLTPLIVNLFSLPV